MRRLVESFFVLAIAILMLKDTTACQGHDHNCVGSHESQANCCDGLYCHKPVSTWAEGKCYYGMPHSGQGGHQKTHGSEGGLSGGLLSADQFRRTMEACESSSQPDQYPRVLKAIQLAGITSKEELAMFLANIYHESATLRYVSELNPEAGYSGGVAYKGRGYIQLTHDYNYRDASIGMYGDDRLVKNPELVEKDLDVAWAVTAWFWKARVKPTLNLADFDSSVKAINSRELYGYSEQLARRKRYHSAIKNILVS
ncbi:hypothetical protein RvY_16177 [Ramazzottius varieornatus]|uniref:Glycoside hydrolase family 19 catalytic domain-containing protein n=1 Tax=Ramazzottius varieornatus TaxID=947166 RepID=A0A1D1VYW9_RAMVA|nr:hypothetical protein RvY_16177 [Ramazzottius varieornatus]